jgi:hypothetical protein
VYEEQNLLLPGCVDVPGKRQLCFLLAVAAWRCLGRNICGLSDPHNYQQLSAQRQIAQMSLHAASLRWLMRRYFLASIQSMASGLA